MFFYSFVVIGGYPRRGTGGDRQQLCSGVFRRRLSMVGANRNVVIIHKTTFTAAPNSTPATQRSLIDRIRCLIVDMTTRFGGLRKKSAMRPRAPTNGPRLADYLRTAPLMQKR
jgi:hypothetical protein